MAPQETKPPAVVELERIAHDGGQAGDSHFERYLECPQLQKSSEVLGRAVVVMREGGHHGAFTARTHTPLPAPPGWLPPPI